MLIGFNGRLTDMKELEEICQIISGLKTVEEIKEFLIGIFTDTELVTLSKRWRILKMLNNGYTQREIAKNLNVGLCCVTRGARVIKDKNSIVVKYLKKGKNNE